MKKKIVALIFIVVMAFGVMPVTAFAASVSINNLNFPDAAFRAYVSEVADGNSDNMLSDEELAAVKKIDISYKNISSLKGIEFFTQLTELDCSGNELSSLDVSKNTKLTKLECVDNELSGLDVTQNTQLTDLNCFENKLTSLDVSKNTKLLALDCGCNKLTGLDLSQNTQLTKLECIDNDFYGFDVSKNAQLSKLDCSRCELTRLDVSKNTQLTDLNCFDNELPNLDVSKNTKLLVLDCGYNRLTSIDVSKNTQLEKLSCTDNEITSLDVSHNTKLTKLNCKRTSISTLDITSCPLLFANELEMDDYVDVIFGCTSRRFTDAPAKGNWAHEGIDYCIFHGLMNGMSDTTFVPNGTVTRAQLVTILYRLAGEPYVEFKGTFTDVPAGKWYSSPIEWAAAHDIVNGTAPGKFNPMGNITREQIATILYRYSGSPVMTGLASHYAKNQFALLPDHDMVHSYAYDAILWAYDAAYINGVQKGEETYLAPQAYATRAQIAAIIMRYLDGGYECS